MTSKNLYFKLMREDWELEGKVAGLAAEARSLGMDKKEFVRMAEEQFGGEETV